MATVCARERALVLRLQLVVELLEDALADLVHDQLWVDAGSDRRPEAGDDRRGPEVGLERVRDLGVLDLHGDNAAVRQPATMDLADRGGGRGVVLEILQHRLGRLAPLVLEYRADLLPAHRRRGVTERGKLLLIGVAVLRWDEVDVDERGHLPDLHGTAAK